MSLPPELERTIAQYNTWIDDELKKEEANKIGDTLYHYTTISGVKGIIESDSIWFTDFRCLNDPSEIEHGIGICREVIRLRKSGTDGRVVMFLDMLADFMRLENFTRALEYFIGSFSRASDDLGQWRAYADNGRGVSIGLAPHLFQVESTTDKKPNEAAFVSPVIYDMDMSSSRHIRAIEKAESIFFDVANEHRKMLANQEIGIPFMQEFAKAVIASPLIWNCLTSKHPAYTHEQERLIILGMHDKLRPYIQTRIRGADIVPYISYKMPVRQPHSIAQILVGPAANADEERTVQTMLESLGIQHDIPITRSHIPYRAV